MQKKRLCIHNIHSHRFIQILFPNSRALSFSLSIVNKTTALRLKSSVWYALGCLCASSCFLSEVQCCSFWEFITSRPVPILSCTLISATHPESKQHCVLHLHLPHPSVSVRCPLPCVFINVWSMLHLIGHLKIWICLSTALLPSYTLPLLICVLTTSSSLSFFLPWQ